MTTEELSELRAKADAAIERIVRENSLAIEALTEKQIVELLKQVFASGDIIRNVVVGSNAQQVIYVPGAEVDRLRGQVDAVRRLCSVQHESSIWWKDDGRYLVPCECLECVLKRSILDKLDHGCNS